MSTKATVAYGPNFHLYKEVLSENFIYLELEGVSFEASTSSWYLFPSIFGK